MKRWAPWLLLVIGMCALVFANRSESPNLLRDTDTVALLNRIREVSDPMSWFKGDWPLQNHFYRPISTLTFEWDHVLEDGSDGGHKSWNAAAYGRTNAVLAILCILLLFWFLREATDVPWLTGTATALFAVWHFGESYLRWAEIGIAWLGPICLLGHLRGGVSKIAPCAFAALGCVFLSSQLLPVEEFGWRIVEWLPGRTASVMTLFALLSLATYSRYVRTSGELMGPAATALDVPATKSTRVLRTEAWPVGLLVLSCIGLLLALGSYEQAVMLPALLFGVWLMFRLRGYRSAWWPHLVFWALLFGYLLLRTQLVPTDVSGYQAQQFRSGPGLWMALGDYLLPGAYSLYSSFYTITAGWLIVLNGSFWSPVFTALANVTTYWKGWSDRQWKWPLIGYLLLSFFAFLPMAWLHPFGHYHYLPSAFRAAFVAVLAVVVLRLVVTAASLPELRAPARRGPAPGSLLRP